MKRTSVLFLIVIALLIFQALSVAAPVPAPVLPEGFWAPLKHSEGDAEGRPLAVLYAVGDLGRAPADQEQDEFYYFFYSASVRLENPLQEDCELVSLSPCPEAEGTVSRCRATIPAGIAGASPLVPGKYLLTCGFHKKEIMLVKGENLIEIP